MKKFYILFSLLFVTGLVFGQMVPKTINYGAEQVNVPKVLDRQYLKTENDTIGWNTGMPMFAYPEVAIYTYQLTTSDGKRIGYWFGTNYDPIEDYSLSYWAQCYINEGNTVKIIGALAMIIGKENISANPHSKVVVSLYAMGDEETIVGKQGENYIKGPGPAYYQGTPLGTASMSINSIDTLWNPNLGLNYFPFEESVTISKDFAIVADFTALVTYSDTAYMPCDEPGNGLGLHYAQYSRDPNQYLWISTDFGTNGTLNVNIPLFAVVDNSSANINSHDFFHGMQMTVYPNPVSEVANIDFALQHNTDVTFEIININGQVVNSVNLGYQTIGTHTTSIDINELTTGNYFISMNAMGTRFVKPFIVQ